MTTFTSFADARSYIYNAGHSDLSFQKETFVARELWAAHNSGERDYSTALQIALQTLGYVFDRKAIRIVSEEALAADVLSHLVDAVVHRAEGCTVTVAYLRDASDETLRTLLDDDDNVIAYTV